MGITETDLLYKYTGTAGTTNPQTSLGGTISINTIPSGVDNNLFDDVTGDESAAGRQEYRAIAIHNSKAGYIWMNTKAYTTGYVRAGSNNDVVYFGTERPAGAGGNPDGTIQVIAADTTAPAAVSWTAEGIPSSTVSISGKDYVGSIGSDDWSGLWIQRSVPVGASAYNNRSCTIRCIGETSASPEIIETYTEFALHWQGDEFWIEKIGKGPLEAKILDIRASRD